MSAECTDPPTPTEWGMEHSAQWRLICFSSAVIKSTAPVDGWVRKEWAALWQPSLKPEVGFDLDCPHEQGKVQGTRSKIQLCNLPVLAQTLQAQLKAMFSVSITLTGSGLNAHPIFGVSSPTNKSKYFSSVDSIHVLAFQYYHELKSMNTTSRATGKTLGFCFSFQFCSAFIYYLLSTPERVTWKLKKEEP